MILLAMTFSPLAASIVAFIGVTGLLSACVLMLDDAKSSSVEDRLQVLAGKKNTAAAEGPKLTRETFVADGKSGLAFLSNYLFKRFDSFKLIYLQADVSLKPDAFCMIIAGCAVGGILLCSLFSAPVPLYPLAVVAMGSLPVFWLLYMRSRRFKKFAAQLPDGMELIARALRSGHSLASAIKVVVDELPDPISKEFNIAYEEQNLGIPLDTALKNLYTRMPNIDYKFFAMAVAIQRQSGGDLAEILDKIGHIIRERFRILGQVQALTGEGRISGIVLMALPILLFFAVWKLNAEYVMMLFTDELGRKMIGGAVVLQILGAITIKKIVAIKV